MLTIECVGADVSAHWTMDQRLLVFAPPVVLTLFSVALFALFWPTDLHIEDLPGRQLGDVYLTHGRGVAGSKGPGEGAGGRKRE